MASHIHRTLIVSCTDEMTPTKLHIDFQNMKSKFEILLWREPFMIHQPTVAAGVSRGRAGSGKSWKTRKEI